MPYIIRLVGAFRITIRTFCSSVLLFALIENGGGRVLDAGIPAVQTATWVVQCREMRYLRLVLRHQAGPPRGTQTCLQSTYQAVLSEWPQLWSAALPSLWQSAGKYNLLPALQITGGTESALPTQQGGGRVEEERWIQKSSKHLREQTWRKNKICFNSQ